MAPVPPIQAVEPGDDYIHVRFRDPDAFDEIRTPDWAEKAAGSISDGAEVRTGQKRGTDDWEVQSVLIPKPVGEGMAREQAQRIVEEIES